MYSKLQSMKQKILRRNSKYKGKGKIEVLYFTAENLDAFLEKNQGKPYSFMFYPVEHDDDIVPYAVGITPSKRDGLHLEVFICHQTETVQDDLFRTIDDLMNERDPY